MLPFVAARRTLAAAAAAAAAAGRPRAALSLAGTRAAALSTAASPWERFAKERKEYDEEGYTVVRNAIDADLVGELSEHVKFIAVRSLFFGGGGDGARTRGRAKKKTPKSAYRNR
jgi:hypothetical protein